MSIFQTREQKQKCKTTLIVSTIVLSMLFVLLVIYGFVSVRPNDIEKASKLGQYYEFNSASLPSDANTIQKDAGSRKVQTRGGVLDITIPYASEEELPKSAPLKHTMSILVTNLGLNPLSTELALSLPREVALGFVPYTTSLKPFLNQAHEEGHEIFMYLPFETKRYPDDSPGQMPLLLSLDDNENIRRMNTLLHSFDGYVGVYGAPNEVFTNSSNAGALLIELAGKKLKLFTSNGSVRGGEMAESIISSTIIIDAEPNIPAIKKQLDALVELAKAGKPAIGYAGSYPVTIYALKAWLPTLDSMNIEIVPVTNMITYEVKQ